MYFRPLLGFRWPVVETKSRESTCWHSFSSTYVAKLSQIEESSPVVATLHQYIDLKVTECLGYGRLRLSLNCRCFLYNFSEAINFRVVHMFALFMIFQGCLAVK